MGLALEQGSPVTVDPVAELALAHRELLRRVAVTSDRRSFQALFEHFAPRIKAVLVKSGADYALAEDLVQDVMMTMWHKAALYNPGRGSVATWVYTIARNARIDRLRLKSSQPYIDIETIEIAAEGADGEAGTVAAQTAEGVAAALTNLPLEQREIIEHAFLHDLSQSEIAEKLGLPLGTVKSRQRLAYAKFRDRLGDHR